MDRRESLAVNWLTPRDSAEKKDGSPMWTLNALATVLPATLQRDLVVQLHRPLNQGETTTEVNEIYLINAEN